MNNAATQQLDNLLQALDSDDMTSVRIALVELLSMGYEGDHAADLRPYKHTIIKMLLEYLKAEMFKHTKAFIWQLNKLGVTWPDLDIIKDTATAADNQ
jgi:hypothetical protein